MRYLVNIFLLFMMIEGFLYSDSLFNSVNPVTSSIFTDKRARKIGDIITVVISESSNSKQSGSTKLSKKSSLEAQIRSILFPVASTPSSSTNSLNAHLPYVGSRMGTHRGTLPESNMESEADFEGDGELESSNNVSGSITAMIIEVLPNGNFIIEGKRHLTVDKQERIIMLSGIVRPEDIGADNSVLSRFIADAKITFEGTGPVNDQRKRGLIQRIMDFIGLY